MTPSFCIKLYAVAVVTFLVLDMVWLGIVARSFYHDQMGHLLRENVNWAAAIVFYLVFVGGIIVLAVLPAIEHQSATRGLLLGAILGLVTYAAYDLTNLATLKGFPLTVAIIDMAWGTVLCSTVAVVTYFASAKIG